MDRADRPPLSLLGGQLKQGLREEGKKETVLEDLGSFAFGLILYLYRRAFRLLSWLVRFVFSGFTLTEQFKFWLSRRFVRRKGQLAFPLTHAALVGLSLSLLVATAALSGIIFQKPKQIVSGSNPLILESRNDLITEESKLLRTEVLAYTVQEGETVDDIAKGFRIPAEALIYYNRLSPPYALTAGKELRIPPSKGTPYTVKKDTTVEKLANTLGVDAQAIIDFTYPPIFQVADGTYRLSVGQIINIPDYEGGSIGSIATPSGSCGDLEMIWPAESKNIIQGFLEHVKRVGLRLAGIDIEAGYGDELFAAHDGTVVKVGAPYKYNNMYGGSVFLDVDGTGYQIRYAHMSEVSVAPGQKITAGEVVGAAGDTGYAFGPHLHFELLCNGEKIEPSRYLTK